MGMYPKGNIIKSVPTMDTSAYGATDLLFDKQELKNIVPSRGGCSILHNISLYADITTDVDIAVLFFDNSTGIGASANDALTEITDAEFQAAGFIGSLHLNKGEQAISIGNGLVYCIPGGDGAASHHGVPLLLKAADAETSIWYVAITYAGTPTYDANSLSFTFNVEYLG
tara:strand:- start:238 stop:747 length:510 start_codon:yes stop_codon:yes gene_type:complete